MNVRAVLHTLAPIAIVVVALFAGLLLQAHRANAQGFSDTGSDAQCVPAIPVCGCGLIMQNGKCVGGSNKYLCPCTQTDNGFTTAGVCQATQKCQAQSTGGKSPDSGLGQLGQALGQILGALKSAAGGGSGSGSGSSPTTATGCQSSYYYTSNTSIIGADPCALYQPATSCSDPNASNYGAQATCLYNTSLTSSTGSSSAQDLLNELTGSNGSGSGSSTTNTNDLSASPTSGASPLQVTFTTGSVAQSSYTIDPGDGSGPQSLSIPQVCTTSVPASCTYTMSYTYQTAGTYTAILADSLGDQLGTVSIAVTNPGGSTTTGTGSGLTDVFNSIGGLFTGASSTAGLSNGDQSSSNFPGVLGNILLDQNGATIFAQTVNSANNSETSGFYGSDTIGGQPQGVVSSMCQGRPWASNFLANIIPPSFFDSLCQWGGFQVGQTQPQTQTQTQPQVTLTQQTSTAPAKTSTQTQATSTAPTVAAQAVIWAVPASVPLGTRTSVFWNTQGVTQCTETSPDGSFNESSLSGAAATVPLTQATTYTISCLDPNGNPITNYVTVTLSS